MQFDCIMREPFIQYLHCLICGFSAEIKLKNYGVTDVEGPGDRVVQIFCFFRSLRPEDNFFLYLYLLGAYIAYGLPGLESFILFFLFWLVLSAKTLFELSIPAEKSTITFFSFQAEPFFHRGEKLVAFCLLAGVFFISGGLLLKTSFLALPLLLAVIWMLGRITTNRLRELLTRALICALMAPGFYLVINRPQYIECFLFALALGSWWFGLGILNISTPEKYAGYFFRFEPLHTLAYFSLTVSILSWLAFGSRLETGVLFSGGLSLVGIVILGLITVFPALPDKFNSNLFDFSTFIMSLTFFLLMLFDFVI